MAACRTAHVTALLVMLFAALLVMLFAPSTYVATENFPTTHGATVVLHVGPHKTASTSVQFDLLDQESVLGLDDWTILHSEQFWNVQEHKPHQVKNVAACYTGVKLPHASVKDQADACSNWLNFTAQLNGTEKVVMSSEEFSLVDEQMAQLASDLSEFSTIIVTVYRPFYEWIASIYRQERSSFQWRKGPNESQMLPFSEWLTVPRMEEHVYEFTTSVYKRYAANFSDVRMHILGPSLLAEIVCDDLHAKNTCDHCQASNMSVHNAKANYTQTSHTTADGCLSSDILQKLLTMSIDLHREALGPAIKFPKSDFDTKASTCFGNQ